MLVEYKVKAPIVHLIETLHTADTFALIDDPASATHPHNTWMKMVDRYSKTSGYCPVVVLDTGYQTELPVGTRVVKIKVRLIVE